MFFAWLRAPDGHRLRLDAELRELKAELFDLGPGPAGAPGDRWHALELSPAFPAEGGEAPFELPGPQGVEKEKVLAKVPAGLEPGSRILLRGLGASALEETSRSSCGSPGLEAPVREGPTARLEVQLPGRASVRRLRAS